MVFSSEHRLSLRVRLLCLGVFLGGSLLPPYVPSSALSPEGADPIVAEDPVVLVEEGFLMKSSSLTEQGTRLAYSESIIHTVREGESLERIADLYSIAVPTIQWANTLTPGLPIRPGQELRILPVNGVLHVVKRGQTLSRIAELYGIPAETIARQNKVEGGFIVANQTLIIPGGAPIVARAAAEKALTFGDKIPGGKVTTPTVPKTGISRAPAIAAQVTRGVLQLPCNACAFTQYFRSGHYGVDIQTKGGGPVFAAEAGTVIRSDLGWNGGYGNVIEVDHGNGLVTLYAHNKEHYVEKGQGVARGQVISWMGNTGRVYGQTGIHTHFEVHVHGVKKNPMLYLE